MENKTKKTISIDTLDEAAIIYGNRDKYLRLIKSELGVDITARDEKVKVVGDEAQVKMVSDIFETMIDTVKSSGRLSEKDVISMILSKKNGLNSDDNIYEETEKRRNRETGETLNADLKKEPLQNHPKIDLFFKGVAIKPKSAGQRKYVESIKKHDVVFCIGPAGTGKTYLAVALALSALKNDIVEKIVLARPAVEAGEKLGFLPGDIHAKINPYLRPLYDALANMMDTAQVKKYLENDLIEILPLAFMRGRTLNNSFVILDEAQNCTTRQMKTFLTRLGIGSKVVITGDITQIDLPIGEISGLIDVQGKLTEISGIDFVHLEKDDIVRHKLVRDIVNAYENSGQ